MPFSLRHEKNRATAIDADAARPARASLPAGPPVFNPDDLMYAADLIAQADALIVAAGAGMGVDSGLPDFRGTEGFWRAYPALGREKLDFTQIASPQAFHSKPARAWGFYGHRLQLYRQTEPHAGFEILKRWGDALPLGCAVFTSNVDGQFQKAGFDANAIEECHGSLHHLQCLGPCGHDIWTADAFIPHVDEPHCLLLNEAPHCPHCGGLARPNVLMFSDFDWLEQRAAQQTRAMRGWLSQVHRPVVIEIGAGSAIPSVRMFSHQVITHHGGRLIRINPRESDVPTPFDVGLAAGAVQALQALDQIVA